MLEFGGACRTGYTLDGSSSSARPYDEAEAVVDLYDQDGNPLRHVSSRRYDTLYWQPWRTVAELPPGARTAVVTLRAVGGLYGLLFNSASFDTMQLSVALTDTPHAFLGGNLLANALFEDGLEGWDADGLVVVGRDIWLGPICNANVNSYTGEYWVGTPLLGSTTGLTQQVDLADLADWIDAGDLAVSWGAAMRTLLGYGDVGLTLTFRDAAGAELGTRTLGPVGFAEWFVYEDTAAVPTGTRSLDFVWSSHAAALDAGFLDAPFVFPLLAP